MLPCTASSIMMQMQLKFSWIWAVESVKVFNCICLVMLFVFFFNVGRIVTLILLIEVFFLFVMLILK